MEVDRKKLVAWLEKRWKGPTLCPVCGHNDCNVPDRVFEAREFFGGGLMVGPGKLLPFVSIMCNFCGHTLLFNAIALDIVEPPQKAEDGDG